MKVSDSRFSQAEFLAASEDVLSGTDLMTVALNDGGSPHAFTAYFAYRHFEAGIELIFLSDPSTRHGKAIERSAEVSLAIFVQTTNWGDAIQGIQGNGHAEQLAGQSGDDALRAYGARFPAFGEKVSSLSDLAESGSSSKPYLITLTSIDLTNEKRFDQRTMVSAS